MKFQALQLAISFVSFHRNIMWKKAFVKRWTPSSMVASSSSGSPQSPFANWVSKWNFSCGAECPKYQVYIYVLMVLHNLFYLKLLYIILYIHMLYLLCNFTTICHQVSFEEMCLSSLIGFKILLVNHQQQPFHGIQPRIEVRNSPAGLKILEDWLLDLRRWLNFFLE